MAENKSKKYDRQRKSGQNLKYKNEDRAVKSKAVRMLRHWAVRSAKIMNEGSPFQFNSRRHYKQVTAYSFAIEVMLRREQRQHSTFTALPVFAQAHARKVVFG